MRDHDERGADLLREPLNVSEELAHRVQVRSLGADRGKVERVDQHELRWTLVELVGHRGEVALVAQPRGREAHAHLPDEVDDRQVLARANGLGAPEEVARPTLAQERRHRTLGAGEPAEPRPATCH